MSQQKKFKCISNHEEKPPWLHFNHDALNAVFILQKGLGVPGIPNRGPGQGRAAGRGMMGPGGPTPGLQGPMPGLGGPAPGSMAPQRGGFGPPPGLRGPPPGMPRGGFGRGFGY